MKKILVIEDDELLGGIMVEKLKAEGFDVTLSKDGALGFQKISDMKPDIVLLDMVVPTLSGYEILEAKQKNSATKNIPVLVISNSGQKVEIENIKNLGVKDYIIKAQFSPSEVVDKVKNILGIVIAFEKDGKTKTGAKLIGKKILLVEDDEFLAELLSKKLIMEGTQLIHASDGEDALTKIESVVPDAIVLDMILPGMSGYEMLEKIKSDKRFAYIPVLILTNLSQKEDEERAKKLDVKEFLFKSEYTLDEIVNKIAGVVDGK